MFYVRNFILDYGETSLPRWSHDGPPYFSSATPPKLSKDA
jgi:hypothetical protein